MQPIVPRPAAASQRTNPVCSAPCFNLQMPRTHTLLHPQRDPAPTRQAATILLLRDGAAGLEVLMTRRSMTASFAPGAYVFPGGGVDANDALAGEFAARRATQSIAHTTQALAAIRESFEELGILLARRADGSHCTGQDIATLDRSAPFYPQMQARGHSLCADAVYLLAHWTTDRDLPRRFEVPFLAARMPEGQHPVADEAEQFEPLWVSPADALARHRAGNFFIIFPTIRTLERLLAHATVDAVLAACASEQPLWTSCPRAGFLAGAEARYMEHEPPFGELAMVCPDGQILHHLDWQHDKPVQLLRHVARLTAPNPSVMTGPGTNSYIVGSAETGYIVIDPGPNDAGHVQRLFDATCGDIRAIVCTHSHADHSPAARPLQALCAAQPPILGLPSAATARASAQFLPDKVLSNNEQLSQYLRRLDADSTIEMRAVHTPGHAANHLCLLLEEDGLLFSGDHILNGSTTVIDPPDGNMTDYLHSLDVLSAECVAHNIEFILPAHGYVIGNASQAIAHLKAHRLKREAKVAAALRALPGASIEELVPLAYDDVDARLWPIAARSLTAHVEKLQRDALTP
jgi:recombination protein RecT